MAKRANRKYKALVLKKILEEATDEKHPLTISQLIACLDHQGISAERKSIYDDVEVLRQAGYDVQFRSGAGGGWYLGQRTFQLAELKMLVDAVQAAHFLTRRKSQDLIKKLESLTSVYEARQLQRQVYTEGRIKNRNESIYHNVDKLHSAQQQNCAVRFYYFAYNQNKQKVHRRNGELYVVSPKGLIWDHENYYLVGWDHKYQEIRHYRVDRMQEISFTGLSARDEEQNINLAVYANRHFGMFGGREATVRLRCVNHLAGVILDRFGLDVSLKPEGEHHFIVCADVVVSPQFWGWLFGLGEEAVLLEPFWAVQEYERRLEEVERQYR